MEKSLSYWKTLYLIHARSKCFQNKVKRSLEIIDEFFTQCKNPCVSISGGKDSTVIMDLSRKIKKNVKMVSEKDDMDFPEELEYMENLKKKYSLNLDIISPSVKLWDIIKNYDFLEDVHGKNTNFSKEFFYKILKEHKEKHNIDGIVLGLRAEESKGRRYNFKKRGFIYWNETLQEMVCQPIAHWTGKDIFAYLFKYEIPILDVYFKTLFVDSPEDIRKAWVLPSGQSSQGSVSWLKYYYPLIYQKLCDMNLLMSTYA